MTYLQLVNAVLVRLREDQVSSVTDTDYSTLIGALVNDAKRLVEDAWQWSALRTTLSIGTANGTATYGLTGAGNNITIETVTIPSENLELTQRSVTWLRTNFNTSLNTAPTTWVQDGVDANGDAQVSFWPTPDQNYTVNFECFKRQDDLSANDDVPLVPFRPVLHLAVALAARERGEVGGQTAAELFAIAQQSLTDAIGHDYTKYDAQLDWYYE